MMDEVVVIKLVRSKGRLSMSMPCTAKNAPPSPMSRNVGKAIPSVSRVLIVYIACGI